MATKVVMEALSPTMEEGRLVAWKKQEGDAVKAGDTLAEVETDKAVMELVARGDGVLRKVMLAEGATAPVGTTVAIVGAPDEDISSLVGQADVRTDAASAPGAVAAGGERAGAGSAAASPVGAQQGAARPGEATAAAGPVGAQPSAPPGPTEPAAATAGPIGAPPGPTESAAAMTPMAAATRVRSSPLARRLAAEKGLDLKLIAGSGPAGRVVRRDVETAVVAPTARVAAPIASGGFKDVPLTQIRKTIAKRLAQSLGPIPHFFLTSEIDMERAFEARQHLKSLGDQYAVSFNDLVIKAAALALRRHPAVNAWWMEDRIRYHGDVHVGMAVAVEDGLITPVIRFADRVGLAEISARARELAERARARKLTPEEYTGATFSVSNLGMLDIDEFTAVINPPETSILAVGRIAPKPVVVDGAVVVRRMMRVTMSCDHRVIDGATGARFLQTVKLMLENPLAMLL
ncbi:MAG: dihydrolipoamide acetyltransferase family protein [Gemmatimonadales bacterium]|nr:dihydrolipoamide acetyltransferase family protein [Gemmatimonadales bacterium]